MSELGKVKKRYLNAKTEAAHCRAIAPRKIIELLAVAWCGQIQIMEREQNGVKSGDSDALHRFRVALRKTRALLKLFALSLPEAKQLNADFSWVAALTNPIRDADIVLQDPFAAEQSQALAALINKIGADRYEALQNLIAAIDSRRYRLLIMQWRTYISELPTKKTALNYQRRSKDFLHEMLLMQMHKLLKKSSHNQQPNVPAKNLHKLRIRSKILRYFIEIFPKLLDDTRIKPAYKHLKQLQTILGQHQDNVMTVDLLEQLSEEVDEDTVEDNTARRALDMWIDFAENRQQIACVYYHDTVMKIASACNHLPP